MSQVWYKPRIGGVWTREEPEDPIDGYTLYMPDDTNPNDGDWFFKMAGIRCPAVYYKYEIDMESGAVGECTVTATEPDT